VCSGRQVPPLPRDALDEPLWLKKPLGEPPSSAPPVFNEVSVPPRSLVPAVQPPYGLLKLKMRGSVQDRLFKKKFKPSPKTAQVCAPTCNTRARRGAQVRSVFC
jgi:hypothetical protein